MSELNDYTMADTGQVCSGRPQEARRGRQGEWSLGPGLAGLPRLPAPLHGLRQVNRAANRTSRSINTYTAGWRTLRRTRGITRQYLAWTMTVARTPSSMAMLVPGNVSGADSDV